MHAMLRARCGTVKSEVLQPIKELPRHLGAPFGARWRAYLAKRGLYALSPRKRRYACYRGTVDSACGQPHAGPRFDQA